MSVSDSFRRFIPSHHIDRPLDDLRRETVQINIHDVLQGIRTYPLISGNRGWGQNGVLTFYILVYGLANSQPSLFPGRFGSGLYRCRLIFCLFFCWGGNGYSLPSYHNANIPVTGWNLFGCWELQEDHLLRSTPPGET